jgi:hypothetical protein
LRKGAPVAIREKNSLPDYPEWIISSMFKKIKGNE